MDKNKVTELIKKESLRLGFSSVGISQSSFLEEEAPKLEKWLKDKSHGEMGYMENHFDKRLDSQKLVEGSKSVISLLYNYYTPTLQKDSTAPKISKYAYGRDYHKVVKQKLKELYSFIHENFGEVEGRYFVDSAPVLEKAWAKKSGLGWIGKNANLITKEQGSFFFLAELILDIELNHDSPIKDYCGSCTACIDACPTEAIIKPYVVDGSRCISYSTIELKESIPIGMQGKFENWAFGCDICQDVCPWNRFSLQHNENQFDPSEQLLNLTKPEWNEMSEDLFNEVFEGTPVKRTKFDGLKRNIKFLGVTK